MTPSGARGAAVWPRKRGICRVSAALLLRRAQRRLLRAAWLSPLSAGFSVSGLAAKTRQNAVFPRLSLGGACGAACCVLRCCPPVG